MSLRIKSHPTRKLSWCNTKFSYLALLKLKLVRRIVLLKVFFEAKGKIKTLHRPSPYSLDGCIANQSNRAFVNYGKLCIKAVQPIDSRRNVDYRISLKSEDFFQRLTLKSLFNASYKYLIISSSLLSLAMLELLVLSIEQRTVFKIPWTVIFFVAAKVDTPRVCNQILNPN